MKEELWRSNRGGAIMEEESWRMLHGGGIMERVTHESPGSTQEAQGGTQMAPGHPRLQGPLREGNSNHSQLKCKKKQLCQFLERVLRVCVIQYEFLRGSMLASSYDGS